MPKLKPLAWSSEDEIYNYILVRSHAVKLTQKRMAARLGMTQQNISKKIRKRQLTLSEAVEILGMLNADIEVKEVDEQYRRIKRME